MIEIYEIPLEHVEEFVVVFGYCCCESVKHCIKLPRVCGNILGQIQRLTRQDPSRTHFEFWTAASLEAPFYLNYSMINYGELHMALIISCSICIGDMHSSLIFNYMLFEQSSGTVIFGRTVFQFSIRLASV